MSSTKGTTFECSRAVSDYIFLMILDKYKNDCRLPFYNFKTEQFSSDIKDYKDGNFGLKIPLEDLNFEPSVTETIYKKMMDCKARKKLLIIPTGYSGHRNVLIINTLTDTIEYYEPHGESKRRKNKNLKELNQILNRFTKELNRLGEGKIKLKYSGSKASCPILPKELRDLKPESRQWMGLQSFEKGLNKKENRDLKRFGMLFTKQSGFCCAWSFLQIEMRLKFPLLPENEISSKFVKMLKNNKAETLRNFIYGYADKLMETVYKELASTRKIELFLQKPKLQFLMINDIIMKLFNKLGGELN